jgi:hypothetical protein
MAEPVLKNSVEVGLGRVIEQFEDKPNIVGTLDAFLQETQKVEDLAFEVNSAFDLDTAVGGQLDVIGRLVGESRQGKSDELYRAALRNRITANSANGTINNILSIVRNSLGPSVSYPNLINTMGNPYNPEGWNTNLLFMTMENQEVLNPVGYPVVGLTTIIYNLLGAGTIISSTYSDAVNIGDEFSIAIVAKSITNDNALRLEFTDSLGDLGSVSLNMETGALVGGGGGLINQVWQVTDLQDGFKLFETTMTAYRAATDIDFEVFFDDGAVFEGAPSIGSQCYVQAAFGGKTSGYPAKVSDGTDKYVKLHEHYPADIHVEVQDNESPALHALLSEISSAGVARTMTFIPEAGDPLVSVELEILRRFLITDTGDQIVTDDGLGTKSNLVVSNIVDSTGNVSMGFLAELDPSEGDEYNVLAETLRV